MSRRYGLKDRRDMAINEDKRALLASGRRISPELRDAIRTHDGRKVFEAIAADAQKPGAWFPHTIRFAVEQVQRTKSDADYADLADRASRIYVNVPVEGEADAFARESAAPS